MEIENKKQWLEQEIIAALKEFWEDVEDMPSVFKSDGRLMVEFKDSNCTAYDVKLSERPSVPVVGVVPICGFPGIGKTHASMLLGIPDSDSSGFSWLEPGVTRHPEWPVNYVRHLAGMRGPVFVSTHKEVRDALQSVGIPYILCIPDRACKAEYLERYKNRGSSAEFIGLLDRMWDSWLDELEQDENASSSVILGAGKYAADIGWHTLPACGDGASGNYLEALSDPDDVGSSEYRAVYELLVETCGNSMEAIHTLVELAEVVDKLKLKLLLANHRKALRNL